MSNNSIFYESKPSREQLRWQLSQMRQSENPDYQCGGCPKEKS
jgi:hypothetical protein